MTTSILNLSGIDPDPTPNPNLDRPMPPSMPAFMEPPRRQQTHDGDGVTITAVQLPFRALFGLAFRGLLALSLASIVLSIAGGAIYFAGAAIVGLLS